MIVAVLGAGEYQYQHQQQQQQHGHQQAPIPIVKQDSHQNHDGSYQYVYETGNGIRAQEQGYVKNAGQKDHEVQVAQGEYSYPGPDGHPISVQYIADENGFQASGAHLPTPPPVPKEIQEALAKIASQPQYHEEQHQQQHYQKQQQYKQY